MWEYGGVGGPFSLPYSHTPTHPYSHTVQTGQLFFRNGLKLTEWWLRLDNSKIQEIPKLMAEWVLRLGKRIFRWPLLSWQSLVLLLVASWILTTASATLGNVIDAATKRLPTYNNFVDALPFYWVYITNLPFDIITIMVTAWILRFVLRSSVVKSMAAVLFDILIAALLVWICMASINWIRPYTE